MKKSLLFVLMLLQVTFLSELHAQPTTYTNDFSSALTADWTTVNGTWAATGGILQQTNTVAADPKKLLLTKSGYNLASSTAQQVVARVRVDVWNGGDDRTGVCLMSNTASLYRGYCFLLRPTNTVNLLSDGYEWATAVSFTWSTETWYWMKLKIESSSLSGKIWKDGDSEPGLWTITQALGEASWSLSSGYPGVVGSSIATTTSSFDDVTVSTPSAFIPYIENFNSATICNEWIVKNGTWSVSGDVCQESSTGTNADPKKLQLTKTGFEIAKTNPQMMLAKVRVDTWSDGDMARAGVSLLNNSSSQGYCLLFHYNHSTLQFLNDGVAWSTETAFNWSNSTWYWFKIQYQDDVLYGKVWQDGNAEPEAWTITKTGWTTRSPGQAALVSGSKSGSEAGYATVSYDEVMFADPRYVAATGGVSDPSSFTASPASQTQINLSWVKNGSNNNVMVAWNSTNTFGTPTGSYSAGNSISGGGTVLYNGSGTTYSHTGLTAGTTYYYKAWPVDGSTQYSSGVTSNATTEAAEVIRFVTQDGAGAKDGTSWANAYDNTQLQTAIDEAGVTEVWVATGTYKPTTGADRTISFRMKNNVAIYGGFAGTEDPATFDLDDRNFVTNLTILSGDIGTIGLNTDNCYRVVFNPDQNPDINSTSILDGFTVTGGKANYDIYNLGGGICNDSYSSPTLTNVTISNNSANGGGGYYNGESSSPTINNSIFWGNSATSDGNQIYINGGTTTLNYSCYSNSTGDVAIAESGTFTATNHNITTDPKFVDVDNDDLRLYGNSPCVNTGNNDYNTEETDIRGQARIQNTKIDMGAYEWTSGTDPATDILDISWSGLISTDWNDDDNWEGGVAPYTTDNAIIPAVVNASLF